MLQFLSLVPKSVWKYAAIIIAAVSILTFTYLRGYDKAEDKYLAEIAAFNAQAQLLESRLEAALAHVEVKVVTEYVDRVQTIKEKEYVYRDKIVTVPSKCELSSGWVLLHDASARGDDADSTGVTDATPSGVKDTEALDGIVGNYSICQQNAEQLKALQDWVVYAQAEVARLNKEVQEAQKKRNR